MKYYFIVFCTLFAVNFTQAANIYPNQADNNCMELVENNFYMIQKNAAKLTEKLSNRENAKIVENVKLQFSYMKEYLGNADLNLKFIHISDIICKKSETEIRGTISHEFGHIVSMIISKELSEDRKKDLNNYNYAYWEMQANFFGAKIFKQGNISSKEYLKIKEQECKKGLGIMHACNAYKYWNMGLNNKVLLEDTKL